MLLLKAVEVFGKQHNNDIFDIFVNFMFQSGIDYQFSMKHNSFLTCNNQSVYSSQMNVDRYVIFVLLVIYEKLGC